MPAGTDDFRATQNLKGSGTHDDIDTGVRPER